MPLKACAGYWELMLVRAALNVPGFISPSAGFCSDDAVAEALRYAADNGAKVANLSLGGPGEAPALRDALLYATQRGVFIAAAMGNGKEDGNPVEYPGAYAAEIEGMMSVGAIGKSSTPAYYSTTGSTEIAAPGGNDRDGGGEDRGFIWQVTLNPFDSEPGDVLIPRFDRYLEVGYEGTSMATAHVSGLAALLMSQGNLRNPRAIEALIKATARDLAGPGRDNETGHGLIQPRIALFGSGISR
jgi:serine protease